MARFRKKPVVIDAVRYLGDGVFEESPDWIAEAVQSDNASIITMFGKAAVYSSPGARTYSIAHRGDWIVRASAGDLYAVKAEVFPTIYEAVDLIDLEGAVEALRR